MREIYCRECSREIETRTNLVVAYSLLGVHPYHGSCYSQALKGLQALVVGNKPINGLSGIVQAAVSILLLLFYSIFVPTEIMSSGGYLLIPLFLVLPCVWGYSWFRFVRHLR